MASPAGVTIGVFDSGAGGLTVLGQLLHRIPEASYIYFGDTARLPYGSKSAETVRRYATGAARFLEDQGAGRIVVACNTASALALPAIAASVRVPVNGVIECGADSAAKMSVTRKVAVIATEATVASHAYRKALEARGLQAREMACPLLVPLVEEGWLDHPVTEQVARIYLDRLFHGRPPQDSTDVLVLGCTHYPLLKPVIARLTPERVHIVDSAESVAAAVQQQIKPGITLSDANISAGAASLSAVRFFVSDSAEKFRTLGERLLGAAMTHVEHVDIDGG